MLHASLRGLLKEQSPSSSCFWRAPQHLTRIVDIGHGHLAVSVEQPVVCHSSLNRFLPIVHGIAPCGEDVEDYIACPAAAPDLPWCTFVAGIAYISRGFLGSKAFLRFGAL